MKTFCCGLQYGDEGKARVAGWYQEKFNINWSIRFNGGSNAGHTYYKNNIKFALHQLPVGSLLGKKIALDTGMVINPSKLQKECEQVGIKLSDIYVSENVHIVTKEHINKDFEGSGVGSTKQGIAYVYSDRALRKGIRAGQYYKLNPGPMIYRGLPPVEKNESVLYEGAQAIMLDIDYGHYPYVTSSNILPSIAHKITDVVGIMKAYTSKVGDGPFPPEVLGLSDKGQEFGTTTGRRRKCTWIIMDELKYALSIVQPDEIVITKLDILKDMTVKVWENKQEKIIGNIDSYCNFLLENFPQIKYFSFSSKGDLQLAK